MAEETSHLDINLFRTQKGGNPDIVRKSQEQRFKSVELVDKVIDLDNQWLKAEFNCRAAKTEVNKISKQVGIAKREGGNTEELQAKAKEINADIVKLEELMKTLNTERIKTMNMIGNIVHHTSVISADEVDNGVVRTWGENVGKPLNHVAILNALQGMDCERGVKVAGGRGYFLRGDIVLLNYALINYGLQFLAKRGFTGLQPPFFMRKSAMAQCAQLEQFDEELYHVSGDGDDKYLIATSEQPIAVYHAGETIDPADLENGPIRYMGMSTNFRKEAGKHGADTSGIFRTHQFEKIEQFCITKPDGEESWKEMDNMINNAEEFYKSLGIPYRVVNIVSGALNNAAAKKFDLEGWYPGADGGKGTFRELVSCSNCTDYQSRRLNIRYGTKKVGTGADARPQFVHMLNSTLCATERLICCIMENYQTETGVNVPEVLQPFMMGTTHIAFKTTKSEKPTTA